MLAFLKTTVQGMGASYRANMFICRLKIYSFGANICFFGSNDSYGWEQNFKLLTEHLLFWSIDILLCPIVCSFPRVDWAIQFDSDDCRDEG
jgi:hypothetical protein